MTPTLSIVMLTMASRDRIRVPVLDGLLAQARGLGADIELVLGLDSDATLTYAEAQAVAANGIAWQGVRGQWATVTDKQNAVIARTQGAWVTLWDDDDWSAPDRLTKTLEATGTTDADLIGVEQILYHELTAPTRRTVQFTTPAVIVDGLVTFRRKLWAAAPFEVKSKHGDVGDWIVQRTRAGATVRATAFDYVAMIHGTNATRAQPFRVDPVNGKVFDGPHEFKLVGERDAAATVMSEPTLQRFEAAVR